MSIHEAMQTQKWYYLHNTRSAYFPINRRLCRESVQEREIGYVHPLNSENTETVLYPEYEICIFPYQ